MLLAVCLSDVNMYWWPKTQCHQIRVWRKMWRTTTGRRVAVSLGKLLRCRAASTSSSASAQSDCVLLRDHIGRVLTDPAAGYFSTRPHVVGKLQEPLEFKFMVGKAG